LPAGPSGSRRAESGRRAAAGPTGHHHGDRPHASWHGPRLRRTRHGEAHSALPCAASRRNRSRGHRTHQPDSSGSGARRGEGGDKASTRARRGGMTAHRSLRSSATGAHRRSSPWPPATSTRGWRRYACCHISISMHYGAPVPRITCPPAPAARPQWCARDLRGVVMGVAQRLDRHVRLALAGENGQLS
jgi:hypothetical protein